MAVAVPLCSVAPTSNRVAVWSYSTVGADLNAVWGSSATDVYAVGSSGTILHFDGNAWQAIPSGTTATLYGVGGSSATDVYVTGDGTILHYDGS